MATGASGGASAAKKKEGLVTLMSGDGESFEVEAAAVAALSVTIRHAIEEGFSDQPIPLPIVGARALALAVEYCRKHHSLVGGAGEDSAAFDDELRTFDYNLAKVDRDTLFDLIEAANYLEIEGLLNLMCQTAAGMMKGKSIEELRRTFDVSNDYTPEEEEEVRREVSWALD